jgi:hypothetical protein
MEVRSKDDCDFRQAVTPLDLKARVFVFQDLLGFAFRESDSCTSLIFSASQFRFENRDSTTTLTLRCVNLFSADFSEIQCDLYVSVTIQKTNQSSKTAQDWHSLVFHIFVVAHSDLGTASTLSMLFVTVVNLYKGKNKERN